MDAVADKRIADLLGHRWTIELLRGIAAIAFGVLTWIRPDITVKTLLLVFGVYALLDGILVAATAIENRREQKYWPLMLLAGLVGIGIGILTFITPGVTAFALLFYIAAWAIARGVLEVAVAIRARKQIDGEWRLVLAGIASVAFGLILMLRPGASVLTLLWLIGIYAVAFGILHVMLAFKVRNLAHHMGRPATT